MKTLVCHKRLCVQNILNLRNVCSIKYFYSLFFWNYPKLINSKETKQVKNKQTSHHMHI